jgi:hypothetical protein
MISENYRIETFFDAIEGKTYTEAITLANMEATEAERHLLQKKNRPHSNNHENIEYVDGLKEFILFIRCSVLRNRISKDKYYKLFNSYLESV